MDPITIGLIGAGLGLGKSALIDAPQEKRDRKMEAAIAQWSPWTGMSPQRVKRADPLGSAMQGGVTGLGMARNIKDLQGPPPGDIGGNMQGEYEQFAAQPVDLQSQVAPQGGQYNLGSNSPWLSYPAKQQYNLGR